jgi:hypothetical protein
MGELHVSAHPREGDAKAGIQFFSGSHWEVSVPAFAGMRGVRAAACSYRSPRAIMAHECVRA